MKREKKKILIFVPTYLPGVKGGGPIKSIKNIVENLQRECDFYIVTADRDFGDKKAYENILVNTWLKIEGATIFYSEKKLHNITSMKKILKFKEWDCIYFNGFFPYYFSILPLWILKFEKTNNIKLIVSPRGEFDNGALALKNTKKKIYLYLSKIFRIYKNVYWHATCNEEVHNIEKKFGANAKVQLATNLTDAKSPLNYFEQKKKKKNGEINIVFLSRISAKKNLLFALETLDGLKGQIIFDIYGPIEDSIYWDKCQKTIEKFEKNIVVNYKGTLDNNQVQDILNHYDLFYLPTKGENYGHAIIEAFLSACPVLISDKTPWKNLENKKCGWDIDLNNKEMYKEVLKKIVSMDDEKYKKHSLAAYNYGLSKLSNDRDIESHAVLFEYLD